MPRGNKTTATVARQERDLKAYSLALSGISVRGIMEELGIKSTQTAWSAIERGKKIALEKGIDVEERRIDIDRMFKETLGLLVSTAKTQAFEGQVETTHGPQGTIIKTKKGIDPRIAGELSRSLNRWAEFCGLLDRAPEVNAAAITMVQLGTPADGVSFADKWSQQPAVDVTPESAENGSCGHESEHVLASSSPDALVSLDRPTVEGAVAEENPSIPESQGRIVPRGHEQQTPTDVEGAQ